MVESTGRHWASKRIDRQRAAQLALRVLIAATLALIAEAGSSVFAQTYPARPIRLLIGLAPGGTQDFVARTVTGPLAGQLGQSMVLDNRAGAGGVVAADIVAKAAPDGHTLLHTSVAFIINPSIYRKLPYDINRDFAPVTLVARGVGYLLIVNPGVNATTLDAFVALARSKDRPLTFGSAGVGNNLHLVGELFNLRAGTYLRHIPYKGGAPAVNALIGGEIHSVFVPPTATVVQQMKAGRLRALAFTGARRWSQLPDVPTVAEAGVRKFEASGAWHGWFAPAATPQNAVHRIQAAAHKVLAMPEIRETLANGGYEAVGNTPEQFRIVMRTEGAEMAEAVRAAGIKPE